MNKKRIFTVFALCCAFALSPKVWANNGDDLTVKDGQTSKDITPTNEVEATSDILAVGDVQTLALPIDGNTAVSATQATYDDRLEKIEKALSLMPKISGYLQTGYAYGDKKGGDISTFQMKRMRLLMDKKINNMFDFRAQFEVYSGSTDGTAYKKKVMTVMDAYINTHFSKAFHVRAGQFFLPTGFENYDISPATSETIDFSNLCLRMLCRNPVSSPNLIDYGRDIGVMLYGDLFQSQDQKSNYLSYNLSVTNGSVITLADDNKSKDVVGRLTFRPIEKLRIIGSYNWGEYKNNDDKNVLVPGSKKHNQLSRYQAGAWYFDPNGLSLRSEYGFLRSKDANVKENTVYVLAAYRINNIIPVVRWDMYRDTEHRTSAVNRDNILLGCTYEVIKDVKLQANYIMSLYTKDVKNANNKALDGVGNAVQIMLLAKF